MEDLNLLFSLIAILLSLASVILVTIRIGIGLGMEFAEKEEIRKMRNEIEKKLKIEWIERIKHFIKDYSKELEAIATKEAVFTEIGELGKATRHTQTASILLKILKKVIFNVIKLVVGLLIIAIIMALTIWVAFAFPDFWSFSLLQSENNWFGLFFIPLAIFVLLTNETRKGIRNYIFLRAQFYELSENPTLSKAEEIIAELKAKELLYA